MTDELKLDLIHLHPQSTRITSAPRSSDSPFILSFHQVSHPSRRDLWEQIHHETHRPFHVHRPWQVVEDPQRDRVRLQKVCEKAVKLQPLLMSGLSDLLHQTCEADGVEIQVKKYAGHLDRNPLKFSVAVRDGSERRVDAYGIQFARKYYGFKVCSFREVDSHGL
jgi:hypothetical protein